MERINYVRKLGDYELQQLTQIFYRSANVICVDIRKESSYGRIEGLITDVLLENPEDFTLRTDTMYMTDYEIDSMFEPQNKQEHDRRIRLYQEKMQDIFGEKYKKDLEIEKRRKSDGAPIGGADRQIFRRAGAVHRPVVRDRRARPHRPGRR